MNRMDRLTAILLLLQGGKRTAGEIAQRFEVSKRTIQRDIQALGEIGIPIIAELGVSGGYTLPSDYSLPPLALTLHEALLLLLSRSAYSSPGQRFSHCHDEDHDAFMTLPSYTRTREGEVPHLGRGPKPCQLGL